MIKRVIIILVFCFSCKEKQKETCLDKFNELYMKRYSLWFHFNEEVKYDNYSIESYKKKEKELNDSLSIFIDCAINNNGQKEILYLYKMKQLYLDDRLSEIPVFAKSIDKNKFTEKYYFQLVLYKMLSEELLKKRSRDNSHYMFLNEEFISKKLNIIYQSRATEFFLQYLMDNRKENFIKNIKKQGWDIEDIKLKNREDIIRNIMIRGDNFVFD